MMAAGGRYEPVAREAYPYAVVPALCAMSAWWVELPWAALALLILTGAILLFFRNPERRPADPSEDALTSPADGRVVRISDSYFLHPHFAPQPSHCISVFMSVFNVHVNRSPVSALIQSVTPTSGRFLDARNPDASRVNTQNSIVMDAGGDPIEVVQVAGFIARRISCWIEPGDEVARGGRIGVVHFGSRVDIYLPTSYTIRVTVGDKVRAGETIIAARNPPDAL